MSQVLVETQPDGLRGWTTEVADTEEQLARLDSDIRSMLEDPTVPISQIMRRNSERAEIQAYLRGLRFFSDRLTSTP